MAFTTPKAAVLFRNNQQAMASDNKAAPAILATVMAPAPSSVVPINNDTIRDGTTISAIPVSASKTAVTANNDLNG